MATELQKRAVDNLVEMRGVPRKLGKAMIKAGYDPTSAKNPKNLTESKGYKELIESYGLTEGLITKALVSDIKTKPKKRIMELNLGAEILGMKKRLETNAPSVVILNVAGEAMTKYGTHQTTEPSNQ